MDIIYAVIKESCHSSTPYGLPRILTHSRQGWCCPEELIIQFWCPAYCTLSSIIRSPTESDLGWPTQLMASVYSDYKSNIIAPVTRTIGSKVKHKNKPLTMRLTCIVSLWPLSCTYQCTMSYDAIIFHYFLYACVYNIIFIILLIHHLFSQSRVHILFKRYFMWVVNMHVWCIL